MAIIRVNIVTERACFCQLFTDHQKALTDTDAFLSENDLNDGCSLGSEEDFLALNAMLAEQFDDCYNAENYAQWDDIEGSLIEYLQKNVNHQEHLQPGTVSRASLLNEDITLACIMAIYSVDPGRVNSILENNTAAAAALFDKVVYSAKNDWWETEEAFLFVNETLSDIMEELAPSGYYFGANEGDSSDFGYWPDEDHLEDYE